MTEFLQDGGHFMYAILGVSVIAATLIVEKFYSLNVNYPYDEEFFLGVLNLIRAGDITRAFTLCHRTGHPLAALIAHLLSHHGETKEELQETAVIEFKKMVPLIQKRTAYINMLGNVATLLGLLGTIYGLITSFASLSAADPSAKAQALSDGISTAMNTTAFGLIVAIPCVIAYTILSNQELAILQNYEATSNEVVHCLSKAAPPSSSEKEPKHPFFG